MILEVLTDTSFLNIPISKRGKVRDIYDLGDKLLIISTDRISAFDVVMSEGIPGKGIVLNTLSAFWFNQTEDIVPNHLITTNPSDFPHPFSKHKTELSGRTMLVEKAKPLAFEFVVRGYLSGGGWKEYLEKGSVSGIRLPAGLKQAEKLPEPILTPSTKAEIGEHDISVTFEDVVRLIGSELAVKTKRISLELYKRGSEIAWERGIILADTKFEFGLKDGEIILIDELFTPDSSRFWPRETYEPGHDQVNMDKQFLRDWLESLKWDKKPPPPPIPPEIISQTAKLYKSIMESIIGSGH